MKSTRPLKGTYTENLSFSSALFFFLCVCGFLMFSLLCCTSAWRSVYVTWCNSEMGRVGMFSDSCIIDINYAVMMFFLSLYNCSHSYFQAVGWGVKWLVCSPECGVQLWVFRKPHDPLGLRVMWLYTTGLKQSSWAPHPCFFFFFKVTIRKQEEYSQNTDTNRTVFSFGCIVLPWLLCPKLPLANVHTSTLIYQSTLFSSASNCFFCHLVINYRLHPSLDNWAGPWLESQACPKTVWPSYKCQRMYGEAFSYVYENA